MSLTMGRRPYGSWKSPIGARLVGSGGVRIDNVQVDGRYVYWRERRPEEQGRNALVRWGGDSAPADVLPSPYSLRSTVHEYGGGDYLVRDGVVWFSNSADQRVHRLEHGVATALTGPRKLRYADFTLTPAGTHLYCVMEDHTESDLQCVDTLALLDAARPGEPRVVARGHDFFGAPRLNPDGTLLAWLSWDHPNMPWDGTDLWTAAVHGDGSLGEPVHVSGGRDESVTQPRWSPDGILHFVSDRGGFWNLYRWAGAGVEPVCTLEAEFAEPDWGFAQSNYAFLPRGRLAAAFWREGFCELAVVVPGAPLQPLDTGYRQLECITTQGEAVYFVGSSSVKATALVRLAIESGSQQTVRQAGALELPVEFVSEPALVDFPTGEGFTGHALYYAPRNPAERAPDESRPPLLVNAHGGPISAAERRLDAEIQFFTSRGFAYIDVDYRGSSGYGRRYRDALKGNWGIADVEDCVNAARHLVTRGLVDPGRIAIRGGSAGGYTTLAALTSTDFFAAGASYYGVADAAVMHEDSPKFEAMTDIVLYGGLKNFHDRSPIHFADRIRAPLIIFQGLKDTIVPPNQAESLMDALRRNRVPFAYVSFAEEGHGFRQAGNLARAAEAELYFYSKVFGFELSEPVEALEIENLPA